MRTLLYGRLFNEWYAKDTSKKIRAVLRAKGMSGKRLCGMAPYGYLSNGEGGLVVDDETAPVVKLIFQLCVEGNGPGKIATILSERGIPTPSTVAFQRMGHTARYDPKHPCHWGSSSISCMLDQQVYLGHTVNFKQTTKSYKDKRLIANPVEKQAVFKNTHEAIIDEETWELVQKARQQRRRRTKMGDMGMFSGLVYCADCGSLHYLNRAKSFQPGREYYVCGTYKREKGDCTAHYIRAVVLEQLVLENLRSVISFASEHEDEFVRQVTSNLLSEQIERQTLSERQLQQQEHRIRDLDTIIMRLYEDNVKGKLSDERFMKLSGDYELEQAELKSRTVELLLQVEATQQQGLNIASFLKIVRRYTNPIELTPALLRELVGKIVVHAPDKSGGHRTQQIDIHYNFVGEIPLSHEIVKRETA